MNKKEKTKATIAEAWPTHLILAEMILVFGKQRSTHLFIGMISGKKTNDLKNNPQN